jgi:8-oxo-dGTP pyrophosphatase MutT (NUDIX family)
LVVRKHSVLLIHRTHDGLDDWVLPGGTPREGESLRACARRELLEETGVSADPSGVALVVESQLPGSLRGLLDIVFVATEPVLGREHCCEPGLVPCFIRPDQTPGLRLHPNFAAQLIHLTDPIPHGYAAYLRNSMQPPDAGGSVPRVVVADARRI